MSRSIDKVPTWKKFTAATAAALGTSGLFLAAGCTSPEAPTTVATASQTGETTPPAPAHLERYTPKDGDFLAPEKIVDLEGEDVYDAFVLTEGSFTTHQEAVNEYFYRNSRLITAGATEGQRGDGMAADWIERMNDQYQREALDAIVGKNQTNQGLVATRHNTLMNWSRSLTTGTGVPYELVIGGEVTESTGSVESGDFTVKVRTKITDNINQTGILQNWPDSPTAPVDEDVSIHFTLNQSSGEWETDISNNS